MARRPDRRDRSRRHRGGRRRRADRDAHAGDALELSGPEALTPADQVANLGEALGRPLRYEPHTDAEARAELGDSPAVDALFRFFSEGEYDDARVVGTVRAVTGRAPGRFADWARAHAGDF